MLIFKALIYIYNAKYDIKRHFKHSSW